MKRVVICLDGTWNDKRTGPYRTNVAKICDAVTPQDRNGIRQDAHYVEGIATKGTREWLTFLKGAVGAGVGDRIKAGYETLARHYEPGDEVFIFGFSRGAFEARSLAGFVSMFGIAKTGGAFSFEDAWRLYRRRPHSRNDAAVTRIRDTTHYPARIKCVGVWDTVGNIGNPFVSSGWLGRRFKFHQIQMTDAIDVGLHALCVDEIRGPFRPSLWTLGPGEELAPGQHVEQVWMPGTHADVGGGWREAQLSDIGLTWMMERVGATTGLELDAARIWLAERVRELTGRRSGDTRFSSILEIAVRLGKLAAAGQEDERNRLREQLQEISERKFDIKLLDALAVMPRPDALGPQHASATGTIFKWSRLFPFIRLINQNMDAIPSWRRSLIGSSRTGKIPEGHVVINESVHPASRERFGKDVIELSGSHGKRIAYVPDNLAVALPAVATAQASAGAGKPRRVKIFTVHGTFAHEADWDNWQDDESSKLDPRLERTFPNRLRDELAKQGVAFDKLDHTQYNWSGGNSHEERRIAAVGLKKLIETVLTKAYAEHGRDYYDAVYIIGHSHGGTVARLCMNLWDKDAGYYVEPKSYDDPKHFEEHRKLLLSDDECPTCRRERHGLVAANSVPRPTGVITFGSPFVTFEKRGGGLLTVNIAVWLFRILFAIPVIVVTMWLFGKLGGSAQPALSAAEAAVKAQQLSFLQTAIYWLWPLAFYWLVAHYVVEGARRYGERWLGDAGSNLLNVVAVAWKLGIVCMIVLYYFGYGTGGWEGAVRQLPFLSWWQSWASSVTIGAVIWLLLVTLPGRYRTWMKNKVDRLRDLLPAKYDPIEDKPVRYLSYHTPGDEAGFHLKAFGAITWLVQTLALASACVLAFGLLLSVYVAIEAYLNSQGTTGIMSRLIGVSAYVDTPEAQDRFIELIDRLTRGPAWIWHHVIGVGGGWHLTLGEVENPRAVVSSYPAALAAVIAIVGFGIMPIVVILTGIAYLVSMRLRGSGLVFGSESAAWTMASRIAATARANDNTVMRRLFISPEAWWKQEMAHCYYYKSDRVIADVARQIASWDELAPSRLWTFERSIASSLRWLVVAFSIASLFAFAVPMAESSAKPKAAPAPGARCAPQPHAVSTEMSMPTGQEIDLPQGMFAIAQSTAASKWSSEVTARQGADWAQVKNARNPKTNAASPLFACTPQTPATGQSQLQFKCRFEAIPCLAPPVAASTPAPAAPAATAPTAPATQPPDNAARR